MNVIRHEDEVAKVVTSSVKVSQSGLHVVADIAATQEAFAVALIEVILPAA